MMRRTEVDFSKTLRDWDGFGVNYVEAAQTRDYKADPQEYGGFSILTEAQRQEIIALIFGEDGLKPGLVKMFLDPFHQKAPGAPYDHETTTHWMRTFVREGLRVTRARGADLSIITTLYGPPAWSTRQKFIRGRDLDPEHKTDVGEYLAAWTRYLLDVEGFPVRVVCLHNEGEDWMRWPLDGSTADRPSHDYNMYLAPRAGRRVPEAPAADPPGPDHFRGGHCARRDDELVSFLGMGLRRRHRRRSRGPGSARPDHIARL